MSTLSLKIPESLHKQARELAKSEGISINQLVASALGEKMVALMTQDYLEQRAKRGDRAAFEAALSKVKNVEPDDARDRL